jgi:purine nucleosidase
LVLQSELPVELIGWQLCRGGAALNQEEIEKVLALGTPLAKFAIECNSKARTAYLEQTGEDGISLPDPVAMSIALDPAIGISWTAHHVDVETDSELTRGMTVVDRLGVAGNRRNKFVWADSLRHAPSTKVCWAIDIPRWKSALYGSLGS